MSTTQQPPINRDQEERQIDRKGIARVKPVGWYTIESKNEESQSLGLNVKFAIEEWLDDGKWQDWRPYQMITYGTAWVVKRDGNLNEHAVEMAIRALGWSGRFEDFENDSVVFNPCQVQIVYEEWENPKTGRVTERHRAEWWKPWDYVPKRQKADVGKLVVLSQKHSSIIGKILRNEQHKQAPAAPGPAAPPPVAVGAVDPEIPF